MLGLLRGLAILTSVTSCALAQPCNVDECADVLVLGAGMAGVAAARTLHVNGVTNFLVLEASDRLGGRIRRDDARNIELGANWIYGLDKEDRERHPLWREWLECDKNGPGGSITPTIGEMDIEFEKIYNGTTYALYNTSESGEYRKRRALYEQAKGEAEERSNSANEYGSVRTGLTSGGWVPNSSLDNFIEWNDIDHYFAVGPEKLSLLHTLPQATTKDFVGTGGEASRYLVTDEKGYSFLADCLARDFKDTTRLKLNTKVAKVEVSNDSVCATLQNSTKYCASYAILTFSMGVLQSAVRGDAYAVQFEPELPMNAINQVTMVHFVKIFLIFNEQFWEDTESDQQFFGHVSETRGYYPIFFTVKNISNTIHVHVTGDLALRVLIQDEEVTENEIMDILRKLYKGNIPDPVDIEISQWDFNPLFVGSYEVYGPGVPRDIFEELHKPMNNRIYLAGSALNDSHFGFVHGAYGSGVNVAKQVAGRLNDENNDGDIFGIVAAVLAPIGVIIFFCILCIILVSKSDNKNIIIVWK